MTAYLRQGLATTVAQILHINFEVLNVNVPLVSLGLSSVSAAQLIGDISEILSVSVHHLFSSVMSAECTIVSLATDLVAQMLRPEVVTAPSPTPTVPLPDDDSFPLLPMQQIYAVGRKFNMPANIHWEVELCAFDCARFEAAMTTLVERHGMLRAWIFDDGQRQRFLSPTDVLGADGWKLDQLHEPATLDEFESVMSSLMERTHQFGIPMTAATFFDIQAVSRANLLGLPAAKRDTVVLSFVFDLIVADAQSLNILTSELSTLYRGEELPAAVPLAYREFVLSKLQQRDEAALQRERAYWVPRTTDVAEDGGLPACPQLPQAQTTADGHTVLRQSSALPVELWRRLQARCSHECVRPNSLLFTIYSEILATWSSSRHFIMNMAFFNRAHSKQELFGNCASTMLVDVDLSKTSQMPLISVVRRLQAAIYESVDHSTFTAGVEVMNGLNRRDETPARAVAPYVFASVLDIPTLDSGGPNLFNWFG